MYTPPTDEPSRVQWLGAVMIMFAIGGAVGGEFVGSAVIFLGGSLLCLFGRDL